MTTPLSDQLMSIADCSPVSRGTRARLQAVALRVAAIERENTSLAGIGGRALRELYATAEKEVRDENARLSHIPTDYAPLSLRHRIMSAMAGSCACNTPTAEAKYHDGSCLYRLLSECAELVRRWPGEPPHCPTCDCQAAPSPVSGKSERDK